MKTKVMLLAALIMMGTGVLSAKEKTEKFKVYGNCSMCEKRIEKAASSVEGVSKADWNKETKLIEVTLDDSKTDMHKVHMAISNAGHDTDLHQAKDEVYNKLPGCCKYDRAKAAPKAAEEHKH
ncbi:heavy-metal-associated domain-containing protein [Gaoshiqia sediminis]|uniref:Heavy-metal-associated domain-containing protein n=1 Tax=Gaoshiqia sediminis TaxID=2986998 RepID=A0AA41Y1T2_9BACT|nr:heavy-metal-associated domain-containing protein [Gaoshiqia sediminis]MCW0481896.1 heavy-metal-associated domain-containing protein [Gaoshiqia sediminis]